MYLKRNKYDSHRKRLFALNILALILFVGILYNVRIDGFLIQIDTWVNQQISTLHTPTLTQVIIFITNLNGVVGNILMGIIVIIFLTYKKWYDACRFYLFSLLGSLILFAGLKQWVARMRPHSELIEVINYSFPSGHATLSMTTALLVYFIFSPKSTSMLSKNILLMVCIVWPLFIAFTRVYLNVHWMSDVLAGLALGLFWVTFVKLILYDKNT